MTSKQAHVAQPFSCVTWNIHRGRGADGRVDPGRIASVLADEVWTEDADALILQEADAEAPPQAGVLDLADIAAITGLRHVEHARFSDESHGFLGVVLFLQPSIAVLDVAVLDLPGQCPRGAVVADLQRGGVRFRLIGTHLSLLQALRWAQMRTISQYLMRHEPCPTILAGDLNEWRPWGGLALAPGLLGASFKGPVRRSFPARFSLLPLDRVLATAPARVRSTQVLDGPGIRMASDHRPLRAEIDLLT